MELNVFDRIELNELTSSLVLGLYPVDSTLADWEMSTRRTRRSYVHPREHESMNSDDLPAPPNYASTIVNSHNLWNSCCRVHCS